jgi:hypothetical protein
MRTLLQVSLPTEATNKALSEPDSMKKLKQYVDSLKPEVVYFTANDMGERSFFAVFDLKDPSKIPVVAEPLFMMYHARVRFRPLMNWEEVEKGVNEVMSMMPH